MHCILLVCDNTLQQVKRFTYLGIVFMSDRSRNKKIDTRMGEVRYCSVVVKRELSNIAKLPVFKSVFVPILTCGLES